MYYFKIFYLFFIAIFISNDLIIAEDNYFKIKGIKFRIGRTHNQILLQKSDGRDQDGKVKRFTMGSNNYTQEGKEGSASVRVWLGENKHTSWTFPFQLEFPENVDEWVFSQYYFDFLIEEKVISTEQISAHQSDYRNLFLLNDFLTEDEINRFCPSLKTGVTKKLECLLYSENFITIIALGKFWGIFLPSNNFRYFSIAGGVGLNYLDVKSKLYICKTTDVNYITNGCDSLNLIDSGEIKNSITISLGLNFLLIKKIKDNGSWEFFKISVFGTAAPFGSYMKYSNRPELAYSPEIINTEIFSYIFYF